MRTLVNLFGCIRHEVMITATRPEKPRACYCEPVSSAHQQAPDVLDGQCGAAEWIFASGGAIDIDVDIGQRPSALPHPSLCAVPAQQLQSVLQCAAVLRVIDDGLAIVLPVHVLVKFLAGLPAV
jgi:hypothetical protein